MALPKNLWANWEFIGNVKVRFSKAWEEKSLSFRRFPNNQGILFVLPCLKKNLVRSTSLCVQGNFHPLRYAKNQFFGVAGLSNL